MLSLPRAWVQSLVEELRYCKLRSVAKKKKKREMISGGGWDGMQAVHRGAVLLLLL